MVDALHGWESRNLDLMSSRKWIKKRPELGMVSCESRQNGKNKICRKRW